MPHHVVLLRAINLGARRRVAMPALREWLEQAGFADVETYLATGNVRVGTSLRSAARVEERVEDVVAQGAGFEVPAIALPLAELAAVADDVRRLPAPVPGDVSRQVLLFRHTLPADVADGLATRDTATDAARVVGRAVHLWLGSGVQGDPLGLARVDVEHGPATMRSAKVLATLEARWC